MGVRKTILVIDDFAAIRNFIRQTLEFEGYASLGAANAQEAVEILQTIDKVDLIITDFHMADGNGIEFLEKIRSNPGTAAIPVIFLSTDSNSALDTATQAGLAVWIKKPYRAQTFFSQIENVFQP